MWALELLAMLNNLLRRDERVKSRGSIDTARLGSILLLLTALLSSPIIAEQADPDKASEGETAGQQTVKSASTTQPESKPAEPSAPPASRPRSRPSEREFDPSEDISEDLSVPFPVDI